MFLMLVAAGALYLALGDLGEALMLLGFVGVVMGITIVQERKTERVLDALRDLSSPRARVVRDGEPRLVAGRDVVSGDLMLLEEGDRVAADSVVLAANDLCADEALLTGESQPVAKRAIAANESTAEVAALHPGGDGLPIVYAGSMIVQGGATVRVFAIGLDTAMGRIGRALATIEEPEGPLQRQTGRLVRRLATIGITLSIVAAALYWLTRGDPLHAFLAGLALAMSVLPEEFPVILTVFMAVGAWRISRRHVLTRRLAVIETLGAATVLCVDKTGTLTENRMSVARLATSEADMTIVGEALPQPSRAQCRLIEGALLASELQPFRHQLDGEYADGGEVAFGPVQVPYKSGLDRIAADGGNDWDRLSRGLGSDYRQLAATCNDDSHRPLNQLLGKFRQSFALIAPPTVLDSNILTLDIANLTEAASKCGYERCIRFRCRAVEEPNDRQVRPLRPRRERPDDSRAAN